LAALALEYRTLIDCSKIPAVAISHLIFTYSALEVVVKTIFKPVELWVDVKQ